MDLMDEIKVNEKDPQWKAFCRIMAIVEMNTVGDNFSREELVFNYKMLTFKYSMEQIKEAVLYLIQNDKFRPKVSDIIKAIEGSADEKANRAWCILLQTLQSKGTYRSVMFTDPRIHYCVNQMGGWLKLGALKEDEAKWLLKEFSVHYKTADKENVRWEHHQTRNHLIGRQEAENHGKDCPCMPELQVEIIDCGKLGVPRDYMEALEMPRSRNNVIEFKVKTIDEEISNG